MRVREKEKRESTQNERLFTSFFFLVQSSAPLFVQQSLPSLIPQLKLLGFFGTSVNPVPQIETNSSSAVTTPSSASSSSNAKRNVTRDRGGESDSDSNTSDVDQMR